MTVKDWLDNAIIQLAAAKGALSDKRPDDCHEFILNAIVALQQHRKRWLRLQKQVKWKGGRRGLERV